MRVVIYGDRVPLPEGRQCKAKLRGYSYPASFYEPGEFEIDEKDPLEITWMDGSDLTDAEWDEYSNLVFDWLLLQGEYENAEPSYDGPWEIPF